MRKKKRNFNAMKLKLWLKLHKMNKAGKAPISLRITIKGKRAEYSTDLRVAPDQWDAANQVLIGTTKAVAKDNDYLDELRSDARQAKNELKGPLLTAAAIAGKLRGEAPAPTVCLLHTLENVLASHYRQANQDTLANFERANVLLQKWRAPALSLDMAWFTLERKQEFIGYLLKQMTPAGVRTYLTALVAMWNRAAVFPVGVKPFEGVRIPKHTPKAKASLSQQQLERLATGVLTGSQHHARNLYRACFYLHGSRISAVLQLRWCDYDGERIEYQAMKGGPLKKVKVREELQAILSEYQPAEPAPNALIFPFLSADFFSFSDAERYRDRKRSVTLAGYHLRQACKTLGLPENIHPHTARHTMARITTEATKDIRATQHVIGHSTYQQTEEYVRDMLTGEIDEAAEAAYDKVAGKANTAPGLIEQLLAALRDPAQATLLRQLVNQ